MDKKYDKVSIGKGEKKRKVPKTYVPKGLSPSDRKKQEKSIIEGKKRPKVKFPTKRSTFTERFEKKYGVKITNRKFIHENILRYAGQDKIINKGMAAYFSSGSRPNVNSRQWGLARLASVIMGGPARRIDKNEWEKYKR